jgi:hypothetical protein
VYKCRNRSRKKCSMVVLQYNKMQKGNDKPPTIDWQAVSLLY